MSAPICILVSVFWIISLTLRYTFFFDDYYGNEKMSGNRAGFVLMLLLLESAIAFCMFFEGGLNKWPKETAEATTQTALTGD